MKAEEGKYGTPWARDELVLALYLYCQIPFAQTKASNAEVQRLAQVLGRTPSSVARKLGNFGAFDPQLAQRGVTGLIHFSKADQQVWEEFFPRWEALVEESRRILARKSAPIANLAANEEPPVISQPTRPTQELRLVMTRLFQSFFRRAVLASYQNVCCVCGIDLPPLLVASHIIPWSVRQETRTDPQNGLCLCVLHDKAFDCGFLSITPDYKVLISPSVQVSRAPFAQATLLTFHEQPVRLPIRFPPKSEYLQWHNDHVLRPEA